MQITAPSSKLAELQRALLPHTPTPAIALIRANQTNYFLSNDSCKVANRLSSISPQVLFTFLCKFYAHSIKQFRELLLHLDDSHSEVTYTQMHQDKQS